MDEKLKKMMIIGIGVFVVLFIFIILISSCSKKTLLPEELELEIATNAKAYYKTHSEELPSNGSKIQLTLADLEAKGIIKSLGKLLDKDTVCSGTLYIENNNDFYMYSPKLSCTTSYDSYTSRNLKDELLSKVVASGNGLYNLGTKYYFRGDNVDNRLLFDGIMWRIIGINEDGSIRLIEETKRVGSIWDDRYNIEKNTTSGINDYIQNGLNSRIKDTLDDIYESEEVLSNNAKGYIRKTNLCIGKRSDNDTLSDGTLECSNILENQYLGLLQFNEFMIASLDANCNSTIANGCENYNYLADFTNSYWTQTADSTNSHKVYKISTVVTSSNANSTAMARLVINISDSTNITGSGTESDPYKVVGFSSELKKNR